MVLELPGGPARGLQSAVGDDGRAYVAAVQPGDAGGAGATVAGVWTASGNLSAWHGPAAVAADVGADAVTLAAGGGVVWLVARETPSPAGDTCIAVTPLAGNGTGDTSACPVRSDWDRPSATVDEGGQLFVLEGPAAAPSPQGAKLLGTTKADESGCCGSALEPQLARRDDQARMVYGPIQKRDGFAQTLVWEVAAGDPSSTVGPEVLHEAGLVNGQPFGFVTDLFANDPPGEGRPALALAPDPHISPGYAGIAAWTTRPPQGREGPPPPTHLHAERFGPYSWWGLPFMLDGNGTSAMPAAAARDGHVAVVWLHSDAAANPAHVGPDATWSLRLWEDGQTWTLDADVHHGPLCVAFLGTPCPGPSPDGDLGGVLGLSMAPGGRTVAAYCADGTGLPAGWCQPKVALGHPSPHRSPRP